MLSGPTVPSPTVGRGRLLAAAVAYGLALVYLNLIPFTFTALSLEEWGERALATPWRHISLSGRADWVANLFLFVPFGFLLGLGTASRRPARAVAGLTVATVTVVALALVIEVLQIPSQRRTVSQNDIVAGVAGGWLGLVLAATAGGRLLELAAWALRPGRRGLQAGLVLYLLAYLALAPFPYDFVVSQAELARKVDGGAFGWWIVRGCTGVRCPGMLLVEILSLMPLGAWLVLSGRLRPAAGGLAGAFLFGAGMGLLVEGLQFFTYSGISQGVSILTRATGTLAGAAAMGWILSVPGHLDGLRPVLRWAGFAVAPLYLIVVLAATNLLTARFRPLDEALGRLPEISFIPFYYHYFTTEIAAMASILYTIALYLPAGMLAWCWSRRRAGRWQAAFLTGALLALAVETGKLLAADLRPDPTNVLLAGTIAALGWAVMEWLARSLREPAAATPESVPAGAVPSSGPPSDPPQGQVRGGARGVALLPLLLGFVVLACALFAALRHPLAPGWMAAAVLLYGIVILRWPWLWLVLVPATLPVLDLTPWTGRLYFDEWDLLVLATLAALYLGWGSGLPGRRPRPPPLRPWGRCWLVVFLLSYAASVTYALWPPAWPPAHAFATLLGPYNALRLARGVLWALLLWPFIAAGGADRRVHFGPLALGMVLGLLGAVASVLWERQVFTGLLDFTTVYRVTGMFSGMHTGGAFVEGYLVTAIPFLAAMLAWRPRLPWWTVAAALFLVACYAVGVTFARAGYAGLLVVLAVILAAAIWHFGRTARVRLAAAVSVMVVGGAGLGVLAHIQRDEFMSQRLDAAQVRADWETRMQHWRQALSPVFADDRATWFGLGVGSYPVVNFWQAVADHRRAPAIHHLAERDGETFLTLLPGGGLYVSQAVGVEPATEYRVRIRARAGEGRAALGVLLCEQWVLYSARCEGGRLALATGDGLAEGTLSLRAPGTHRDGWSGRRPARLVIHNPSRGDYVEVAEVAMTDPQGRERLANGDFGRGMDRWFFSADDHLAWHIKQLWGQVLFEQGMVGVTAWTLLVVAALWGALAALAAGAWSGGIVLASLSGFLAVGMFDSLFDVPRLATLFFLLVLLALAREGERRP